MTDYEVLGLSPTASLDEVKRAFRRKVHELDPGLVNGRRRKEGLGPDPEADARYRQVIEAFERVMATRNGGEVPDWARELITRMRSVGDAAKRLDFSEMFGEMQGFVDRAQQQAAEAAATAADIHDTVTTTIDKAKSVGRGVKGIWNFIFPSSNPGSKKP